MNNSFFFSFVTRKDKNLQLTIRQQNPWRHWQNGKHNYMARKCRCISIHKFINCFFLEMRKKMLHQRNDFTCSWSKGTFFVHSSALHSFNDTNSHKTYIGSCSPPKPHKTNSHVEIQWTLHSILLFLPKFSRGFWESLFLFMVAWSSDL